MAPIVIEFGRARTERRSLTLSRAVKDRILQNFPEKITVAVPGFGTQEFALRSYVKSFLDGVPAPMLKATFEVYGDVDDFEAVTIENTRLDVIGTDHGSFEIGDVHVYYSFDVAAESEGCLSEPCPGPQGTTGERKSRTFKLIWQIDVSVEPGIGGTYEIDEAEVTVVTPAWFPPVEPPPPPEPTLEVDEFDDRSEIEDDEEAIEKDRRKPKKKDKARHKR